MKMVQTSAYALSIETLVILGVFLYSFFRRYKAIAQNAPGKAPKINADKHSRQESIREEIQQSIKKRRQTTEKEFESDHKQTPREEVEFPVPNIQHQDFKIASVRPLNTPSSNSPQASAQQPAHIALKEHKILRKLFLYREIIDIPVALRDLNNGTFQKL